MNRTRRPSQRLRRPPRSFNDVLRAGTSSPHLRPFLGLLLGGALLGILLYNWLGISFGWTAVFLGSGAAVGFVAYLRRAHQQAQQRLAERRAAFLDRLWENSSDPLPHHDAEGTEHSDEG
ncbi:MAG: hypothetical protein KatS3mg115_1713 [Candidatus Poribacteria bacterium]|nr:MAG: hypothetical protein KatS3mg115_1713 [Candidatus Poribacteria bacterium]